LKVVKVVEIVFLRGTSYALVQTLLLKDVSFSHKQRHRQTDDVNSRSYCEQYDRLKSVARLSEWSEQ